MKHPIAAETNSNRERRRSCDNFLTVCCNECPGQREKYDPDEKKSMHICHTHFGDVLYC